MGIVYPAHQPWRTPESNKLRSYIYHKESPNLIIGLFRRNITFMTKNKSPRVSSFKQKVKPSTLVSSPPSGGFLRKYKVYVYVIFIFSHFGQCPC